jgi:hypothetical protein
MPYHVGSKGSSNCGGYPVVDDKGKVMGCHPTKNKAGRQVRALYASGAAMKFYADQNPKIEKDMVEKLGSITDATKATTTAIKALATALNNAKTFTAPKVDIPVTNPTIYASGGRIDSAGNYNSFNQEMADAMGGGNGKTVTINAPVTNYNTTSPEDIGNTLVKIAKYGLVVTG